ncbi:MAG: M20/M25/M40 family metallo-hydrolase [Bacteroidia bacterium]|nr:M20/M25/M40 family metallo-hydrolase [Bacteroidia bacterium]
MGLKPFFADYRQPFGKYTNIVALIEGCDPALKDEYIVLGAHYDHLGVKKGKIYNGADDNASGSAALIEIARELHARRASLKRSVIIAAFDAEELGLFGSSALVKELESTVGIDKVKLMMSVDMVGWYRASGYLELEGSATMREGKRLLEAVASDYSITVKAKGFETSVFTGTDTQGFAEKGVPTLAVTTGLKSPYHKPGDDAELIDYDGLVKVSQYLAALTEKVASDPDFASSGKVARKHSDKIPVFEAGLTLSPTRSSLNFRRSALNTDSAIGFSAGPQFQLNYKHIGLNARALYDFSASRFPDDDDLWGSSLRYRQHALTVPLMLVSNFAATYAFRVYVGVGAYYSYVFQNNACGRTLSSVPVEVAKNQYGIVYCFGIQTGPLSLSFEGRDQKNGFFTGPSAPSARLNTFCVSLGYNF